MDLPSSFSQAGTLVEYGFQAVNHFLELKWDSLYHEEVIWCSLVLFVSGILCSAAGIGGGGVIVAVLMYCGHLAPHDAVPVSKGVVFCGAVISLMLNATKKQQGSQNTLIQWDIIKMMVPMALVGTLLGVLLNIVLPGWAIVVLLVVLLTFMTYVTFEKGLTQYREETAREEGVVDDDNPQSAGAAMLAEPSASGYDTVPAPEAKVRQGLDTIDAVVMGLCLVLTILGGVLRFHVSACAEATGKQIGVPDVCKHPVLYAFFGDGFGNWVAHAEGAQYLGMAICCVPLGACCALAGMYYCRLRKGGEWSHGTLLAYQSVSCLTGVLAGLIGIGGGLVFSPFFLLMQVDPAVAVATSSTCVIFTSSSTTFQYLLIDRIDIVLAVTYGLINCVSSYVGTSAVHLLSDRFANRKSYITLVVAVSVLLSTVLAVLKFVRTVRGEPA